MSTQPGQRILIIDENRAVHDDLRKILCPEPVANTGTEAKPPTRSPEAAHPEFEIDAAFQRSEGVDAMRRAIADGRPYAVAFVEARTPTGVVSIATAEMLWQLDPSLQVVICTARCDSSWQETIRRLGHRDRLLVLEKPFAAIEALQLARALCEKWRLIRGGGGSLAETERVVAERTRELREANQRLEAEMTRRKQAEEHLVRTQRLESIGTLASGIAHDLNNMLSPILMSVNLLNLELPEASRPLATTIESCARRAAGVVRQVLTFARGVHGERTPVQPKLLVREIGKIIAETFPRQILLESRVSGEVSLIEGDSTQLHQVLLNLCVNARDAMPGGGILRIEADDFEVDENYASMMPGARPGSYVRLRVSDTGTGIPRNLIGKIFDPFFTTKTVRKGTGLGLSTTVGIVKSHEGFIDVRSEPGKGTIFDIFLPAAISGTQRAARVEEVPGPVGHGELILVVDDEISIRQVVQTMLTQHGYRTLGAADGAEALSIYASQGDQIDAVFTDVMMPLVDGAALCRALKKMDPNVRIIATTGSDEEDRLQDLLALRIDNVLGKPFTTGMLLTVLRETLSHPPVPDGSPESPHSRPNPAAGAQEHSPTAPSDPAPKQGTTTPGENE